MSEEVKATTEEAVGKKKKGKLPIIIVLVLVLAGGGFFMMKGKSGENEPPPIKLGVVEPLAEFLVNLKEPNAYLRAEIALHLKDGYTKAEFDLSLPAVRDAIILVLGSRSIQQVRTLDGKLALKRDLVTAINKVLEAAAAEAHPPEEPEAAADEKKAADEKGSDTKGEKKGTTHAKKGSSEAKKEEGDPKAPEHPDWDSQTGPVLKLYFTGFATQ